MKFQLSMTKRRSDIISSLTCFDILFKLKIYFYGTVFEINHKIKLQNKLLTPIFTTRYENSFQFFHFKGNVLK